MNKSRVIMVSPDLNAQGGIASVVQEYLRGGLAQKVDLQLVSTHIDGGKLKKCACFLKGLLQFTKFVTTYPDALVHIHLSQKGSFVRKFLLFLIAKLFRRKTLVHIHGSQFESFMNANAVTKMLTRFMFERADRVLVLSARWNAILRSFAPRAKVITIYNPIGMKEMRVDNGEHVRILFLGRLGERKGTYDVLKCIEENRADFDAMKLRFTLAGDGDVENIRYRIKEQSLEDIVSVPGWVSGDQKADYLRNSDVMILPSYHEQMPMSLLEGMSYGYPIIATEVGGIPEMIAPEVNGYLHKAGDVAALGKHLRAIAIDHELRQRMGAKSREIVKQKFESAVILKQLLEIYEELDSPL